MPALKEKLNQKLNSIENIMESKMESESEPEQENNLILLKPNQPDSYVPDFAITLNEARQRLQLLQEFVKEMMVADVDYGMIPGNNKPTLLKSGAEKLCDIYGLAKKVEIINRVKDWNTKVFHYEVKVSLISKKTGLMEAEGIGSCNSREKKYASQDAFDIINVIIKMAKKRALVDAVLSATRSSAIFTQDLEDFDITPAPIPAVNKTLPSQNAVTSTRASMNQKQESPKLNETATKSASRNQLAFIMKLVSEKKIVMREVSSLLFTRYGIRESKLLSTQQADDFIKFLLTYPPKA